MEKEVGFEHLHLHTDYSLLDGYGQVEEYAYRAPQINQKFLCITDHGMMGAIPRQIRACEVMGIQPLFGIELYINDKHVPKKEMAKLDLTEEEKKEIGKSYHLLCIAHSDEGYSNLVQLSSKAWLQFYKKPRATYAQIEEHKKGVTFTSSCYIGEIGQAFDRYGPDRAEEELKRYNKWFSPHFYLEIMLLDFKKQKPYNAWLVKMHEKYHIPMVVSNDTHYCSKHHSQQQRYMLMIRGKKTIKDFENIEDGQDYFELQDTNLWMKSEEELDQKWQEMYSDVIPAEVYTEAKRNTVRIAEHAAGVQIDRSIKLPQIPDADLRLKEATLQGYKWRGFGMDKKYVARLKEELDLICKKGFAAYFLIQQEIVKEARRICPEILGWGNGEEAIGPGRGCLTPEVKVVMGNGSSKPISQFKVGDKVVTRDGSIQVVENVLSYDCNENLVNLKSYYGDNSGVTLTKDHKVLVEKLVRPDNYESWADSTKNARKVIVDPVGDLKWMPAGEIKIGDWVFIPKPTVTIQEPSLIDLKDYVDDLPFMYVEESVIHQDHYNHSAKKINSRKTCSRYVEFNEEWAKLLGIFTGDGWFRKDRGTFVGFTFHSEDGEGVNFLKNICKQYGWQYYVKPSSKKKLVQFYVNSKAFYCYFRKVFDAYEITSQTKHVPDFMFNMPNNIKKAYLLGYRLSDGHKGQYKSTYTTTSVALASQIRFLSWQCDVPVSLNFDSRLDARSGKIQESYALNFSEENRIKCFYRNIEGGFLFKVRDVSEVPYEGKVYDLTVANNHNYLTTSFLVHNSAGGSLICYCLGITDVDPLKHDLLFSRFLSESRGGREMKTKFSGIEIPDEDF